MYSTPVRQTSKGAGSRTSRAISGTLTDFLQFAFRIGLQVALSPLVLHMAGQEALGAYAILTQAISYLALADLGFGVALSRYLAQAYGCDDAGKRFPSLLAAGRTFYLFSNACIAVLTLLFSAHVGSFFLFSSLVERQARIALWMLAAWTLVRTPIVIYAGALVATQNLAAVNLINAVGHILKLLLSLVTVVCGMSLLGLILANIAAEAFTLVVQRRYYFRLYRNGRPGWGIRDWTLFFSMIRFGLGYLLVIVGGRLTMNTDNLVVGKLYGAVEASIYYTTQIPAFLLMGLTWKIADNAAPAMNELFARKENDRLRQSYARLLRYSLLIAVGLAFGLMAFNRTIITLWVGQGQYAGRPMTIALGLFIIFAVANHVNSLILVVHGSVKWLSALSLAGGITNLLLSLWLGRVAGLAGVMIASAVVEFIVMVPLAAKGLKLIRLSFTDLWHQTIVPAVAANVFVLPVVALAHSWRMSLTWPSLVLWSLIFVAVWMIGVAKAGLNEVDIRPLHNYFGRMFSFGR